MFGKCVCLSLTNNGGLVGCRSEGGDLLRRRSLWLVLAAVLLTALVSLGKIKSAAARGARPKTKHTRIHTLAHFQFPHLWTRALNPHFHAHVARRVHSIARTATLSQRAVLIARRLVGVPYAWGGTSPSSGFDCSGLVYFVYSRLGVHLPHSSYAQMDMGRSVGRGNLKPGDLVFFSGASHVGLYLGRGRFIHAPHSGARVTVASLGDPWFSSAYDGARRLLRESPVNRFGMAG